MDSFNVTIAPSRLCGNVAAPPSKSISHRAVISAALADGESIISNLAFSQDVLATLDAVGAIGARVHRIDGSSVAVRGVAGKPRSLAPLPCRESGSTLRFMIPICLLSEDTFKLTGSGRLLSRPLSVYRELFGDRICEPEGNTLTLSAGTPLSFGDYTVPGNISSQFITGLLLALPLCRGESRVTITGELESAPYIELTLDALSAFGIDIIKEDSSLRIPGGRAYLPTDIRIEGDASNAAFFGFAELIGGDVRITGLDPKSKQGDMAFIRYFDELKCRSTSPIDLSDCPDLAPILFSAAALLGGGSFTHTDRLRLKESDRISAMAQELAKLGARLEVFDGLNGGTVRVLPGALHAPAVPLCSHNDHRIAMSMAMLACRFGGTIIGAEAVSKSMPDFFDILASLGAHLQTEKTK